MSAYATPDEWDEWNRIESEYLATHPGDTDYMALYTAYGPRRMAEILRVAAGRRVVVDGVLDPTVRGGGGVSWHYE